MVKALVTPSVLDRAVDVVGFDGYLHNTLISTLQNDEQMQIAQQMQFQTLEMIRTFAASQTVSFLGIHAAGKK
jgi:hypothetical protein